MKSNKYTNKIFSGSKYFLLVPLIIVLVSLIMFIVFSFNTSQDFRQSYTFTISYKSDINNSKYTDCNNIIKNNLYDKFGNTISVVTQKQNEDIEIATLVKVYSNNVDDQTLTDIENVVNNIKSQINIKIGDGHCVASDVVLAQGQYYGSEILWSGISLLVVMAVMFAYLWIRYELKTAVVSLTIAPFVVIMYTALYALLRLPVSTLFCIPLLASVAVGYVVFVLYANATRENLKDDKFAKSTNAEILLDSLDKIRQPLLGITVLATFVYLVVLLLFTKRFVVFAISGLIGIILAIYVSIIISSILWSKMYRKDKDMRLKEEKEKEEKYKKEGNKKKTKEEKEKILV